MKIAYTASRGLCTNDGLKMRGYPGSLVQYILRLFISGHEGIAFRVEHKPIV